MPFSASSMLTAEYPTGLFKEVSWCRSRTIVTKEFRCVFRLFFRLHLSQFYSEVALKVIRL